jgi:hypothetical protein
LARAEFWVRNNTINGNEADPARHRASEVGHMEVR